MCNMCNQEVVDGVYWARNGESGCTQCSSLGLQLLAFGGFGIIMGLYVVYLVK